MKQYKSKTTAYILWVFSIFGILGFHRFYLGKVGTGIIWLFTGGVLGWGAFIDLFTLGGQVDNYNNQIELLRLRTTVKSVPVSLHRTVSVSASQMVVGNNEVPALAPPPGVPVSMPQQYESSMPRTSLRRSNVVGLVAILVLVFVVVLAVLAAFKNKIIKKPSMVQANYTTNITSQLVSIQTSFCNFRASPGARTRILMKLRKGFPCEIYPTKKQGGWYLAVCYKKTGYLYRRCIGR